MQFTKKQIFLALKYIKEDIWDDFWPDVVSYQDYIDNEEYWLKYNFDSHLPTQARSINIPKTTLILRPGHYINFIDRIYYQLLTNIFAKDLDKMLSPKNVSYGYRLSNNENTFLDNYTQNWLKYRDREKQYFKENSMGILLRTDINAYFEHIKINTLIEFISVINSDIDQRVVYELKKLIKCFSDNEIGLPQGNNISSFLSNVYLNSVDQGMQFEGFNYYRYVDDIRVFVENETQARKAIIKLTKLLRPLNLHLNSGKTELIYYEQHKNLENKYTKEMEATEYNIALGHHMYSIAATKLKRIWSQAIGMKKFDKYVFNFCIKRFTKIGSDFPLEDILANNLYDPAFSKEICEYLVAYIDLKEVQLKIVEIINQGLYEFQIIWLIKTLLLAKKINFELREINKERLLQYNNFMLTGYYLILITKFGNIGEKAVIQDLYKTHFFNNSDITRYYILGLIHYESNKTKTNMIFSNHPNLEYLRGNTYPKYFT